QRCWAMMCVFWPGSPVSGRHCCGLSRKPRVPNSARAGQYVLRPLPQTCITRKKLMFTGIVAAIGTIESVKPLGEGDQNTGVRLRVRAAGLPLQDTRLGDSIAIQGACMTVVELFDDAFSVDVSRE